MYYFRSSGQPVAFLVDFSGGWANAQKAKTDFINTTLGLSLSPEQCTEKYVSKHHPTLVDDYRVARVLMKKDENYYASLEARPGAIESAMTLGRLGIPYTASTGIGEDSTSHIDAWLYRNRLFSQVFRVGIFGLANKLAHDYSTKANLVKELPEIVAVFDDDLKKLEPIAGVAPACSLYHLVNETDTGEKHPNVFRSPNGWVGLTHQSPVKHLGTMLARDPRLEWRQENKKTRNPRAA